MGEVVEITNVNAGENQITFNKNGQITTADVAYPANIKYAKPGKSEIGITPGGQVNFIKGLEPKPATSARTNGWAKKESLYKVDNTVEILEGVSLKEYKQVYDSLNKEDDKKCSASTLFKRDDGSYDAALYVTTFTLKNPTTI